MVPKFSLRTSGEILENLPTNNAMAQMLTGHGGFREYLNRFKLSGSPFCTCDEETIETVSHILTECPKYGYERMGCELRTGIALNDRNLKNLIDDDNTRIHFLAFATQTMRKAARANGSTID